MLSFGNESDVDGVNNENVFQKKIISAHDVLYQEDPRLRKELGDLNQTQEKESSLTELEKSTKRDQSEENSDDSSVRYPPKKSQKREEKRKSTISKEYGLHHFLFPRFIRFFFSSIY